MVDEINDSQENKNIADKKSKEQIKGKEGEPKKKEEDIDLNVEFATIAKKVCKDNDIIPNAAIEGEKEEERGVCCPDQCVTQIEISCDKAVFVTEKNYIIFRREQIKEIDKQIKEIDKKINGKDEQIKKKEELENRKKELIEKIKNITNIDISLKSKEYIFDKNLNNIVLVLESPHKDEYDGKNPLGPAIGTTGDNINKYILYNLLTYNYINNQFDSGSYKCFPEIKNGKYNFILMNSVQYQCSLGMTLNNKIKNDIFQACIKDDNFKNNFIERLKKIKPSIIINCCTKEGKRNVQKLINQYVRDNGSQCLLLDGVHPASASFGCGFKKV